jgi:ribose 5-phosphate isomerase B
MKVIIGSDHAGFSMKSQVKTVLEDMGHSVEDVGCHGKAVAAGVARGEFTKGILVCGSGLGMSMIANRFVGVRAALCNDLYSAVLSRRHNDANLLVMGGRLIGADLAGEIVRTWLVTEFDGGRHQGRIAQLDEV